MMLVPVGMMGLIKNEEELVAFFVHEGNPPVEPNPEDGKVGLTVTPVPLEVVEVLMGIAVIVTLIVSLIVVVTWPGV